MQSRVTKAAGNRYCQARLKAAKYNEKLLTRAGAVDYLPGVTEDSLKKYELDITKTPNTVVALMADAYAEPELRAWYWKRQNRGDQRHAARKMRAPNEETHGRHARRPHRICRDC